MILKIRKKPIEITALLLTNTVPLDELLEFVGMDDVKIDGNGCRVWNEPDKQWLTIPLGHYILKGTKNECYPCDPEVFKQIYEVLE